MKSVLSHLRGNVVAYLALFVSLSLGTAWAATQLQKNSVRSKHIANAQVKRPDLRANAVNSQKVADGSLRANDLSPGVIPQPDTPAAVRDKLLGADGSGSGLDADRLDGIDSSGLVREIYSTSATYNPPNLPAGNCSFQGVGAPASVQILPTDTLVVSPTGANRIAVQVTGSMAPPEPGSATSLTAHFCNNGQFGAEDLPSLTVTYRVLR